MLDRLMLAVKGLCEYGINVKSKGEDSLPRVKLIELRVLLGIKDLDGTMYYTGEELVKINLHWWLFD